MLDLMLGGDRPQLTAIPKRRLRTVVGIADTKGGAVKDSLTRKRAGMGARRVQQE
jgi:hypothetical protein